ncbi:hypothetical protein ACLB2K_034091 [Fragaria x ananassa]
MTALYPSSKANGIVDTVIIKIWKASNEMIFRGKTPSIRATMAVVTSHLQNTSCLTNAHPMPQGNKMDIRWFPLSHDRVKINFDGSVRSNYAVGGFIVRTETRKSLAAACFNLGTTTVPVAEAISLRNTRRIKALPKLKLKAILSCCESDCFTYTKNQGLAKIEVEGDSKLVIDFVNEESRRCCSMLQPWHHHCSSCESDCLTYTKNQGLAKIEVEGDSKLVIDSVNGVSSPPWKLHKLVQDIKALSSSFEFVKFKHVFR